MPQAADILSDPEINQAYEDVRSDKSDTTWLVLKVRFESAPNMQICTAYLFGVIGNGNRFLIESDSMHQHHRTI